MPKGSDLDASTKISHPRNKSTHLTSILPAKEIDPFSNAER